MVSAVLRLAGLGFFCVASATPASRASDVKDKKILILGGGVGA